MSLGNPAALYIDENYTKLRPSIAIGYDCEIREFVVVNHSIRENGSTTIADRVMIMARSHVAHDVSILTGAILSTNSICGGHCNILEGAVLGLGCVLHQHTTIGAFAMIAANAAVVKDVPPFSKYIPGKLLSFNWHPIRKGRLSDVEFKRDALNEFHEREIYDRSKLLDNDDLYSTSADKARMVEYFTAFDSTRDKSRQVYT